MDKLGVDIGGVIVDRVQEDGRDSYSGVVPVPGALESIGRLVRERFHDRVWLVSRCDESNERPLLAWMESVDFFAATGVARDRVHFCRSRHEKAPICERLGLTHFVDDRAEVLSHLIGVVPNLYLLESRASGADRYPDVAAQVHRVTKWSEIVAQLL